MQLFYLREFDSEVGHEVVSTEQYSKQEDRNEVEEERDKAKKEEGMDGGGVMWPWRAW